jgi:flagellar hook-associated protein 1
MSTFGGISTAYSGLVAARAALDVAGQNVANVGTDGYTRQRVTQTAVPGAPTAGSTFVSGANIGNGVTVTGVSRLNDALADARVRDTAATSGYWDVAAAAANDVETGLNEPGTSGLSATLGGFWSAWQDMGNQAGSDTSGGAAAALLEQGRTVVARLADGYTAAANAWSTGRQAAAATVATVNDTAARVAALNAAIVTGRATGGSVNELLDQRASAVTTLSRLTGATTRDNADGSVDVVVDGNALVSGAASRRLALTGATTIADAAADPVRVTWADRPSVGAAPGGGELAGRLATLAGPDASGTGGIYAETAKAYDDLAARVATQVNAVHATGTTPSGSTGTAFFAVAAGVPAALGLSVLPASAAQVASADSTKGASDGSVADRIAQLGTAATSPDRSWAAFVAQIATASKSAAGQAIIATQSASAATTTQASQNGVDLDEETSNLVVFQHAYQGAARVLTAVDEMLDTLINKTGLVGR